MDQTRGWCSRTGSQRKVWSWILPGRPEKECWRRVETATRPVVSVRRRGLLCPLLLLHRRRQVGCFRAPSSQNCRTPCASRRWLRGAPPFLRAMSVGIVRERPFPPLLHLHRLLTLSRVSLRSLTAVNSPRLSVLRVPLSGVFPGVCLNVFSVDYRSRYVPVRILLRHRASTARSIRFTTERRWEEAGGDTVGGACGSACGLSQIDR